MFTFHLNFVFFFILSFWMASLSFFFWFFEYVVLQSRINNAHKAIECVCVAVLHLKIENPFSFCLIGLCLIHTHLMQCISFHIVYFLCCLAIEIKSFFFHHLILVLMSFALRQIVFNNCERCNKPFNVKRIWFMVNVLT